MSMPGEQMSGERFRELFESAFENVRRSAVVGVDQVVRLVLSAMLAPGHVLLEANPGTGKTQLALSLARTFGLEHNRIQFTPDLLPSDVTGVSVWTPGTGEFEFRRGPVFTNILLADEINRASPKTQSALLQVMEESEVTVDGVTHAVADPFIVLATQNPIEMSGTYRLPEAQLDRFLISSSMPVPDLDRALTFLVHPEQPNRSLAAREGVLGHSDVAKMRARAQAVAVTESIAAYVYGLAAHIRDNHQVRLGISMRGALAMLRIAKVRALTEGREGVNVDDIQALARSVFEHRIVIHPDAAVDDDVTAHTVVLEALAEVRVPTTREASPYA